MFEEDGDMEISFEEEIELLREAYETSYLIATGKITVQELLERTEGILFLPFDPSEKSSMIEAIDDTIEYFQNEEEYEKCSELLKAKNDLNDV